MLDGWSRLAENRLPEPPSQRSSTNMELGEDMGPTAELVSTPMMFHRAPRVKAENLSTGHQRLNPDRACQRGNFVYTLHDEGIVRPLDTSPMKTEGPSTNNHRRVNLDRT
jgi:hypothetical protein